MESASRSLYNLLNVCFGKSAADFHFDLYCGTINGTDCLTVRYGATYMQLDSIVSVNCGPTNATACSSNCTASLQSIKQYSGCCGLVNQERYDACNITSQAGCTNSLFTSNGATLLIASTTAWLCTAFIVLISLMTISC